MELSASKRKDVACALRPKASVATAESAFDHAISGTNGKRIGVDEIDTIVDELGPDAEAEFMRFFCLRRGWKAPERMTTVEWALQEVSDIRARFASREENDAALREQIDRIEEVLRENLR